METHVTPATTPAAPACTGDVLGVAPGIELLRREIQAAAGEDASVLVAGEPGAGLSLVARTIHQCSRRRWRPFVSLDSRLHSAESLEVELLGDGRSDDRPGNRPASRLEQAAGGTLCIEGLERLSPALRRKVEWIASPQGGGRAASAPGSGVHLIATACTPRGSKRPHDPEALCPGEGRVIAVPPLRERREDIGLLVEHFLHRIAVREGRPARQLTVEALRLLEAGDWPGNVRELEIVVERACAIDGGSHLTGELIRPWLTAAARACDAAIPGLSLKEMERKLIETTFARCRGNRERTARSLGIGIRTLSGKLREYGYPPRGGPGSNQAARERHAA